MKLTTELMGEKVRRVRKQLRITQQDLALTSGTGVRFIIDLEKGKPTCQIGKVLRVLNTLGIEFSISTPIVRTNLSKPRED